MLIIYLGGENISERASTIMQKEKVSASIRKPTVNDGAAVWQLVKNTKILDVNSSYSYLLWCSHFSETSIVIEEDHEIIGFISGYIKPGANDCLFIWQVAVAEKGRGKGLATQMLKDLLTREVCKDIHYIETTISPSNIPSQKLFHRLARDLKTDIKMSEFLNADEFPDKGHEDEILHEIGPF